MNPFKYALYLCHELYGINMHEEEFEELAEIAYRKIGNKRVRTYRYIGSADPKTCSMQLPCNAARIEAVTVPQEDWNYVTNQDNQGDNVSSWIEQYTESQKENKSPIYNSGHFVKYEQVGDTLYFQEPYANVCILYRGEVVDEEGLPEITDAEAEAIATYIAYVKKYKEGLATSQAPIIQLAKDLKGEWLIKCDQARIPEYLNQNEMDQILDAKSSWNRKVHNKSFKPIR